MEQYRHLSPHRTHHRYVAALLRWREKHLGMQSLLVVLAVVVGTVSGLAAVLLKFLIATIAGIATSAVNVAQSNLLYLILPAVGILLAGLYVRHIVRDNISHGVTRVLYAIALKQSRLKVHNIYASLVASSVTIGLGGSVGAEGPIVFTGAAIGSNLGRLFRLPPNMLTMLIGCGAAAGIAGIFKAPIAGMLFTIEVLMLDLTAGVAMPLILSSVAGATVAYVFTGYAAEFPFVQSEPFLAGRIPYVVALGVVCGLFSIYFNKVVEMVEGRFAKLSNPWWRFVLGASVLSGLIFVLPPLYGEGYGAITDLLQGCTANLFEGGPFYRFRDDAWALALMILALATMKSFATSATNGGGGVGGTFAPSLYVGCMAGFLFAYVVNLLGIGPEPGLSIKNFTLMGMAGVMHAPLMAMFLTAELTGGYTLFLPLLIVSAISYGTSRLFIPYGIYARRLAQRGQLLTHRKDQSVLTLMRLDELIETDFTTVTPDMSLKEMVHVFGQSNRNIFPVVNDGGHLLGIVLLDDIRNIMFRSDLYHKLHVDRFMTIAPAQVVVDAPMEQVMKLFDETGAWNLPVVDLQGRYIGFVSKSKIFSQYRNVLKHYSYD